MSGGAVHQCKLARIGATAGELFHIANGDQNSNAAPWREFFGDAEAISISSPAVLAETVQIQVDPGNGTFQTLVDSTGTAITVPAAAKSQLYNGIITACANWRLHATGAVTADRDFLVSKAYRA